MQLLQLFLLLFKFLGDHRVVFDNLTLEILFVSEGLLDLLLQVVLILNSLVAVRYKLLGELFDFINLLFELLDGLTFTFYHLFEVVAFKDELRDGLLVKSLVLLADFDQNIESFMLKQGVCVLVFDSLDLLFNLIDFLLLVSDLLLILELTLVVVLDDLQFFESFRKNLVLIEKRIKLPPDGDIIFLKLIKLTHHLLVDILLNPRQKTLLSSS